MKITFVTDTYAPQLNGVANTLLRLVTGLRKSGHEVDVIRPAVLDCHEDGLKVASFALPGYPEIRVGLPRRLRIQARWAQDPPDVIYVATESPLGSSAISAALALGIPIASGFHTNFQQYAAHYQLPLLEDATMRYLRFIHNRTHRTFAPSQDVLTELNRQGFANLELLPRGVDTKQFSQHHRDALLRRQWGAGEGSKVGIYVGRIAPEKNLPLAIETFTELQRRFPDFRGVFVGDGPKLAELKLQHPNFIYAGPRYGADLARHYASADLFVFPSMTETFGNVILEAMASQLAVVTFDYAAGRQHLSHGQNGFTAPFGDAERFKATAVEAVQNSHFDQIRQEARDSALDVSWQNVIERFECTLLELTEPQFPNTTTYGSPPTPTPTRTPLEHVA